MHSGAVVREHYLMRDQEAAARSALAVAQALRSPALGQSPAVIVPQCCLENSTSTRLQTNTNYLAHEWGTAHSCAGDESKKASWDAREIADLRERHARIAQGYPGGKIPMHASVVPQLLKAIHADANAWPIYAKRHILDAGRLTTGFLSFTACI